MAQVFAGPKPVFQQARAAHRRSSWLELHGYHLTEDAGDGTTVEREVFSGQKNTHHLAGGYWKSTIARKQADPQGQTATPDAAIDISRRRTITIGRRATSVACDRVESRSPGLPDIGGKIAGVDGLGNLSADDSLQTGSRLAKLQTTGSVGSTITTSAISPSASTHERLSSSTCPLPQLSRSHQPSTLSSKGDILWPRRRPRRGKTFENIEKHNYNLSGLSRDSIASRSTITNPVHASIRSTTSESKALSLGLSMKFLSKSTPSIGDLIVSSSGTYTQNRCST